MARIGFDFAFDAQQKVRGNVLTCDYSLYSNGITTIKIPFVEEGQRPEDEYFSLGDNEGILVQAGGNGFDTLGLDGVLLLVGELV